MIWPVLTTIIIISLANIWRRLMKTNLNKNCKINMKYLKLPTSRRQTSWYIWYLTIILPHHFLGLQRLLSKILKAPVISLYWLHFTGGFYSDNVGHVAKSCKKCPNGSSVPYDKTPGKQSQDCKSCPQGKLTTLSYTTWLHSRIIVP